MSFQFSLSPASWDARALAQRMKLPASHRALEVLGALRFRVNGIGGFFPLSAFQWAMGHDLPKLPGDNRCLGVLVWAVEDLPLSYASPLEQMIRNGAAMEGLERAVNFFRLMFDRLFGVCPRSLFPGRDIPLEVQRHLADRLGGEAFGIRLTEGNILVPEDSLSALMIPSCSGEEAAAYDQCGSCKDPRCPYRRSSSPKGSSASQSSPSSPSE
ncbi:MAG: hypothetical protein N2315_07340 [Thermanaerothrix sp.]|nr:hypothetical protein [Thermanaerothrix sp.]